MPRRTPLSLPGMPWHMIQRGKNRSACVDSEEDDRFSLDRLTEMTHHVHLLLTPERAASAPLTMKHLGQRYV